MQKHIYIAILFLLSMSYIHAQNISFKAEAPNQVTVGEEFYVNFTLNNAKGGNIKFPDILKDFHVLYGPSISSSTSTKLIKGKQVASISETYTYILKAKNSGNLKLPAATVDSGGKTYKSNSLRINAISQKDKFKELQIIGNDDAFVKSIVKEIETENGKAYEVTFRLYTTINVKGISDASYPDFTDFDILRSRTLGRSMYSGELNGQKYYIIDLKKYLLMPQQSGETSVNGGSVEVIFSRETGNIINSFWGPVPETIEIRKKLEIEPFTIDAGLVGDWKAA